MPFRRRREGKTNYKKREALLKSGLPRLVVRRSNKNIRVQVVLYDTEGDKTVLYKDLRHLKDKGYPAKPNTPSAYLLGILVAKEAQKKGVEEAVLDIVDVPTKGAVVFAVLYGAIKGGLKIKASTDKVVVEERVVGKHISDDVAEQTKKMEQELLSG